MLAQQTLKQFSIGDKTGQLYSLPTLAQTTQYLSISPTCLNPYCS